MHRDMAAGEVAQWTSATAMPYQARLAMGVLLPNYIVKTMVALGTEQSKKLYSLLKPLLALMVFATFMVFGQQTWMPPHQIDPNAARQHEAPLIAVSKTGVIAIVVREGSASTDSGKCVVYHSSDNGSTFLRGSTVKPQTWNNYDIDNPHALAYDTTDALWLLWGWDLLPSPYYLELSKSTDHGMTFQTEAQYQCAPVLRTSRMTIDLRNNIHVLRDSFDISVGPKIIYTRFTDANIARKFEAALPMPPTLAEQGGDVDFAADENLMIHYVTDIVHHTGSVFENRVIKYAVSTNGGSTFSSLLSLDTITPPNQLFPRVVSRDSIVLGTYYFPDTIQSRKAAVSRDRGLTFVPFGYSNSRPWGLAGKCVSDSLYFYSVHGYYTGAVYSKYMDPQGPVLDSASFNGASYADIAVSAGEGNSWCSIIQTSRALSSHQRMSRPW